jgi:predicted nucleic acid-binding Zn ribbon protein
MGSSSSGEKMNVLPGILTATVLARARSRRSANMLANQRIAEWRGLPERKLQADRWQSPSDLMQRLGVRERLRETEVIDAWSKIVGDFIAAHSAPVALREGILYVRVLQPAFHYELEQISKSEILRKLKQRFGSKTIRDVRFRVG